jgi:LysM domain
MADNSSSLAHPTQNVSKDKIKLPMWMWAAGAGVALFFGYRVYKARQAAVAATSSSSTTGSTSSTGTVTQTGCVNSSGTAVACPSYVPVPTATTQGNTPAQQQEFEQLMAAIQAQNAGTATQTGGSPPEAVTGTGIPTTGTAAGSQEEPITQSSINNVAAAANNGAPNCATQFYTVAPNDSWTSIANAFQTTADVLFNYNSTSPDRSPAAVAQFQKQGMGLLYQGQQLLVPSVPRSPAGCLLYPGNTANEPANAGSM